MDITQRLMADAGDFERTRWDFVLHGASTARCRDGKIAYLCDTFGPGVDGELVAWQRENGITLDPSYT